MSLENGDLLLLTEVQKLVELERSLTEAMDLAAPWLPGGTARPLPSSTTTTTTTSETISDNYNNNDDNNDDDDVHKILSVARNLSSRTSAPVGWNPQAPVIGFTTPNPMPHQLRGGALGALQLELARTQQKEAKREQLERKREREEAKRREDETQAAAAAAATAKRPALSSQPQLLRQGSAATAATRQAQPQRPRQPAIVADMNLSDDDDDDSSSDDEE